MSKHDPALAVFALLQLLADAPAAKARLEALVKAKDEADAAIQQQKDMAAGQAAARIHLDALTEDHKKREQSLAQREKALAEAQHEHEQSVALARDIHRNNIADLNQKTADKNAELDAKENDLNERLKAVAEREVVVETAMTRLKQSNEALSHREAALRERQAEHADKVAKLRELTQ